MKKLALKEKATFPRAIWNFHSSISNRSNNTSETFNKKINLEMEKPIPNIYRLINIIQDQFLIQFHLRRQIRVKKNKEKQGRFKRQRNRDCKI